MFDQTMLGRYLTANYKVKANVPCNSLAYRADAFMPGVLLIGCALKQSHVAFLPMVISFQPAVLILWV
jgi:hypothetical protein